MQNRNSKPLTPRIRVQERGMYPARANLLARWIPHGVNQIIQLTPTDRLFQSELDRIARDFGVYLNQRVFRENSSERSNRRIQKSPTPPETLIFADLAFAGTGVDALAFQAPSWLEEILSNSCSALIIPEGEGPHQPQLASLTDCQPYRIHDLQHRAGQRHELLFTNYEVAQSQADLVADPKLREPLDPVTWLRSSAARRIARTKFRRYSAQYPSMTPQQRLKVRMDIGLAK